MVRLLDAGPGRWPACILAAALLAACGTAPRHATYYQEDGPPERVPAGLVATPDAVPRDEPFNPFANQAYRALGRTYVPDTSGRPFRQRGLASWYGRQFQGNRTASGERYDMFAMTAAHPTLPIPSYARVTNLRTRVAVVVRINDRGPFLFDRVIDLSYAAAVRLGVAGRGTDEVEVERILPQEIAHWAVASPVVAAADPPPAAPVPAVPAAPPAPPSIAATAPVAPRGAPLEATLAAVPAPALPATATGPPDAPNWTVQVGAFALAANAEALRDRIALLLAAPDAGDLAPPQRAPRVEADHGFYRVLVGPPTDRAAAAVLAQTLGRVLARATALYFHP